MREQGSDAHVMPSEITRLPTWLLGKTSRTGHRLVQAEFDRYGVTRPQIAVLATLEQHGPLSQAELVRALDIDASNMVAAINDLQEAGLVTRAPDPDDRRRNKVRVTAKGRRKLPQYRAAAQQANDALLEGLTAAERAQLVTLLRKILAEHQVRW